MATQLFAADIRRHWLDIRDKVEEICGHCEEIYAQCRFGRAQLYVVHDGFVVLRETSVAETGAKECLVWIAYGTGVDMIERYLPELRKIAADAGCESIYFRRLKQGAADDGWVKRFTEYSMRV